MVGHDQVRLKRIDRSFSGEDELPRLEHGEKRARHLKAQRILDGGTLLLGGFSVRLGGLSLGDIASARVKRHGYDAAGIEVVRGGNVVEVE